MLRRRHARGPPLFQGVRTAILAHAAASREEASFFKGRKCFKRSPGPGGCLSRTDASLCSRGPRRHARAIDVGQDQFAVSAQLAEAPTLSRPRKHVVVSSRSHGLRSRVGQSAAWIVASQLPTRSRDVWSIQKTGCTLGVLRQAPVPALVSPASPRLALPVVAMSDSETFSLPKAEVRACLPLTHSYMAG